MKAGSLVWCICAALATGPASNKSASESEAGLTLAYQVRDTAGVPANVSRIAHAELRRVFDDLGIDLIQAQELTRSSDGGPSLPCQAVLLVFVVPDGTFRAGGPPGDAMGFTARSPDSGQRAAFVSYGRTVGFARRFRISPGMLLGYVMAHELGHLLLPPLAGHARQGLMKASWMDREIRAATRHGLYFSPREKRAIRLRAIELSSLSIPPGCPADAAAGG